MAEIACIFTIFLIASVQISMECEKQESEADTKTFEFTLINQSINQSINHVF